MGVLVDLSFLEGEQPVETRVSKFIKLTKSADTRERSTVSTSRLTLRNDPLRSRRR
jgi:hypothetical protein